MKKILVSLSSIFLGAVSMDSITAMNNNPTKSEAGTNNFEAQKAEFTQAFQRADLSKMQEIMKQAKNPDEVSELVKLAEGINVTHLIWSLERKTGLKIVDAINSVKNRCDKYSHLELGIKNFNENGGRFNLKDIIMIGDQFKDWGNSSYFGSNGSYQDLTKGDHFFLNDSKAAKVEEDYSTMDKSDKRFAFFLAVKFGHLDLAAKILQIESQSGNVGEKYADLFNLVSRLITPYWLVRDSSHITSEVMTNNDYFALSCVSYGNAFRNVLNYCTEKVDLFKNESSSVKDALVKSFLDRGDHDEILQLAKKLRSYMDDSQLAIVASVNIRRHRAEQAMPALRDFFMWLIEDKGREKAISIVGQSLCWMRYSEEYCRYELVSQLFSNEEKIQMLNFVFLWFHNYDLHLTDIIAQTAVKDVIKTISNIDEKTESLLLDSVVSLYKRCNNTELLMKIVQIILSRFDKYEVEKKRLFIDKLLKNLWRPEEHSRLLSLID